MGMFMPEVLIYLTNTSRAWLRPGHYAGGLVANTNVAFARANTAKAIAPRNARCPVQGEGSRRCTSGGGGAGARLPGVRAGVSEEKTFDHEGQQVFAS